MRNSPLICAESTSRGPYDGASSMPEGETRRAAAETGGFFGASLTSWILVGPPYIVASRPCRNRMKSGLDRHLQGSLEVTDTTSWGKPLDRSSVVAHTFIPRKQHTGLSTRLGSRGGQCVAMQVEADAGVNA